MKKPVSAWSNLRLAPTKGDQMQMRLLLLLLCIVTTVQADPPEGSLLRPPGNFARWQVVSVYSAKTQKKSHRERGSAPTEDRSQKLVTTKTGRMIHEERTNVSQQLTDVWYDGGTQYTHQPGAPVWLRADGNSGDPAYQPLPELGYREVGLIKADNYVGTFMYNTHPCLVFTSDHTQKIDWNKPAAVQKQLKKLETVAFVDEETRLPVEIRAGGETRTFQFDPPPTRMQTLPADLLA